MFMPKCATIYFNPVSSLQAAPGPRLEGQGTLIPGKSVGLFMRGEPRPRLQDLPALRQ